MVFARLVKSTANLRRGFQTSSFKQSAGHEDYGGIPGSNLPFDIKNKYMFTVKYALFMITAWAIPFLTVRHQLIKSATSK